VLVDLREALGSDLMVHGTVAARPVLTEDVREGAEGAFRDSSTVVARFSPRSKVREGETVPVVVETERFHYFDLDTRQSIWS
jgi:multiple sugar transport system ATP-binding protein